MASNRVRWELPAATCLVLAGLTYGLGSHPLLDPDEGRNAEIAREMAVSPSGVPRLNGLPYLDKPVLYFAAGALCIRLFGATEWAARLPSLLFTLGTLAVTWWMGRRWYGARAGWVAAIATGATPLTLGFARTVIFDSALTFFVTLSIAALSEIVRQGPRALVDPPPPPSPQSAPSVLWVSLGLGVLTKGPIALLLPVLAVLPYLGRRGVWRSVLDPTGMLLFLAILLPWVAIVSRVIPDFLRYVIVTETWGRITSNELQRNEPWWYFLPIVIGAALPWSGALAAARRPREAGGVPVLLWSWIIAPLIFFSLVHSKRPQYLLPLMPAVGLLVGGMWAAGPPRRAVSSMALTLACLGAALLVLRGPLGPMFRASAPISSEVQATALGLGLVCLAAGILAWACRARPDLALVMLVLPAAALPFTGRRLLEAIGRERSGADLARAIERRLPPDGDVVGVFVLPLSLPFYLQRPLTLVTRDGRELTSNYLVRHLADWRAAPGSPLRAPDWWQPALDECSSPRVFVVRSDDRTVRPLLERRLELIAETPKYAAFGPCGATDLARQPPADGR